MAFTRPTGLFLGIKCLNTHQTHETLNTLTVNPQTLVFTQGTTITVWIDDASDLNTLERIAALIRSGFGE